MKLPTIRLKRYRVVRDHYCGFEVQVWHLWFPFWVQCWGRGICNTHASLEKAQEFIENHKKQNVVWSE